MKRIMTTTLCLLLATIHLWAGDTIASRLSHRRFTTLDGLPQMQAETVWQDSRGYIWIGTLSGFVRYDGRTLAPYLKGRRENIVAFTETEKGVSALGFRRRWLVDGSEAVMHPIDPSQQWLTHESGEQPRHWLLNNFNATDLPGCMLLLEDEQETHRMIVRMDDDGWTPWLKGEVFDRMTPDRKMYIDGEDIYVPTDQGLYVVRDKQWRRLTAKDDIFTLTRMGSTLYALAADGIYSVNDTRVDITTPYSFESPDYGLFVRQRQDGILFIADAHNLYQYDGHSVGKLAGGFNLIKSLLVDRWGRLWMATYQGVYLFFHNDFTLYRLQDDNDIVRALCADSQGHIVMGTLNGSLFVDGQQCHAEEGQYFNPTATRIGQTVYMVGKGDVAAIDDGRLHWLHLPMNRYQFVAQASGRLIIGTRQEVLSYDGKSLLTDTLSKDIMRPWCCAEDDQGTLWVGSSSGLYRISGWQEGKAATTLQEKKVVSAMTADNHGHVVFASNDSLYLIRHGQVEAMNGQLPLLNGHEIRTVHHSPRGYLVVGAIDGLLIAQVDGDYHVMASQWFDHTNGFTLMEPMNSPMTETDDGTVWLAGLEEMVSFRPERLLSYEPATTIIEEPLPWWRHPAAWLFAMLLLGGASWWIALHIERRRQQNKMVRLQREKKQKELQISAIRLKAIPHFHANVLSGIEYYLLNNSTDEAIDYLKVYSHFTNQTLADIDKPARSVADEVSYIRNYLALEKLRFGERLQYSIIMGDNVNSQALMPTMALYTYCQNAVKHGIGNKAKGGKVEVSVTQREGRLTVAVSDDGVGRAEAAHLNVHSTKQGLRILHEQIELFNQSNDQPIHEAVTDLYDDQGNPAGTRFELSIPLNYRFNN